MTVLPPEAEAILAAMLASPPPLSPAQQDVIARRLKPRTIPAPQAAQAA
jgi:hypothetical protein